VSEDKHGVADVQAGDVPGRADRLGHLGDQQARPGADIEDALAWPQPERPQGGASLLDHVGGE